MKISIKNITPTLAKELLSVNRKNRKIEDKRVFRYADDIQKGNWKSETGEAIKIAKDGSILDGQHRLHAIIKANKSIDLLFIEDLDSSIMPVLDTGKPRSASDVLTINKVKYSTRVASLIQALSHYDKTEDVGQKVSIGLNLTNEAVLNYYYENKDFIDDVILLAGRFYANFQQVLEFFDVALFIYLLKKKHGQKGFEFMRQLCQGTEVSHETIIFLRNKLIANRMNNKAKMTVKTRRAFIIKTFNAYITNNSVRIIKYNSDREDFPTIKN